MTTPPPGTRLPAVCVPVLLLSYGVLRLIDGWDGSHGPGLAWSLGHMMLFVAVVLLGVLIRALQGSAAVGSARRRLLADAAAVAGVFGVGCFLWVTLGDLFPDLAEAAPLPGPLRATGPAALQLGLLTLMVMLTTGATVATGVPGAPGVTGRPPRLPWWSPVLVLVGFAAFAVDLNLLPVGALVLSAGLFPLTRTADRGAVSPPGGPRR